MKKEILKLLVRARHTTYTIREIAFNVDAPLSDVYYLVRYWCRIGVLETTSGFGAPIPETYEHVRLACWRKIPRRGVLLNVEDRDIVTPKTVIHKRRGDTKIMRKYS